MSVTFGFGDAARIIETNARQRVADLQAYIEANPGANDLDTAYAALIADFERLGRSSEAFDAMQSAYTWIAQAGKAPLDLVFSDYVRPTSEAMAKAGERKRGSAFLLQVRKDFRSHPQYAAISAILDQLEETFKGLGIGDALDLSFLDLRNKRHNLKDYRGKVVLIDFWSYTESRNLVLVSGLQAAYEKFHDQGFEILSFSEDNNPTGLEAFVVKRKLKWVHALDKRPENLVADALGITSTPNNFLVDGQGVIIGKNVYDKALLRKVEAALSKGKGTGNQ